MDPACLHLLPTLKLLRSLRFNGDFSDWLGLAAAQASLCSSLTSLQITGAKLTGTTSSNVLQAIGSMRWLQDLAITGIGKLDTPIVPHLTACVALQALDLQGRKLSVPLRLMSQGSVCQEQYGGFCAIGICTSSMGLGMLVDARAVGGGRLKQYHRVLSVVRPQLQDGVGRKITLRG